jgi:hypothetical protein
MDLLDECLTALLSTENKCEILSPTNGKFIYESFFATYPFTRWGQIDWDKVKHEKPWGEIDKIIPSLTKFGQNFNQEEVYIIWGDTNLPVLKCMLVDVLRHIDDITPLGMYATWIYCPSNGWTIEFWHHGKITLGFSNKR